MTAFSNGLRLLPGTGGGRRVHERVSTRRTRALLVVAVVFVLVAALWGMTSERRAIRALPPEQRLTLVDRGVDELKRFCGEGRPQALQEHCHELAAFVAQFEECKGECEALAHLQLTPVPTR